MNKTDSANVQERVISIRGQADSCIKACREILRIMYEDAQNKNKTKYEIDPMENFHSSTFLIVRLY